MEQSSSKPQPLINGRYPKAPFWFASLLTIGFCLSLLLVATLLRSRESHSNQPRVHYVQDMDNQVKAKVQHASTVFNDGRESRPPIPGTISRQNYMEDDHLWHGYTQTWNAGKNAWDVTYDTSFPVKVDDNLLTTGRKKFNTYCMPCHGYDGIGNGPVNVDAMAVMASPFKSMGTNWVQPSNLTDDVRKGRPDGHIFNTITNGIRNMGGYGSAIPNPHDRWAIVAYVRALQLSRTGFTPPATQPGPK